MEILELTTPIELKFSSKGLLYENLIVENDILYFNTHEIWFNSFYKSILENVNSFSIIVFPKPNSRNKQFLLFDDFYIERDLTTNLIYVKNNNEIYIEGEFKNSKYLITKIHIK